MNIVRLRNGKFRLVAGVGVGLLLLVFVYVAHDTRTRLVSTRSQVQECEHRHESLSAQLQVIIEHRSRLEKSVQQEKLAHKQTKDKLESQYEELQELSEKSKQETQAKYSALQQQYKTLQRQQDDLHKEFSKLQQINSELQEEKTNLVNKMTSEMDQLRMAKDAKSVQLQAAITRLEREKEDLILRLDQSPLINQLQHDLLACRTQLRTTSATLLLNHSKPFARPVKEEPVPLIPSNVEAKQQEVKEKTFNNVEQINIPDVNVKSDSIRHFNGPLPQLAQADVKNNRQIPPPLPQFETNNAKQHYLQDNEVNGPDEARQVEQPDRQNKADFDHKEIVHQPMNRQDLVAHNQIAEGKGQELARDPVNAANGLDQQENDEDQDLDNMENEIDDKKNGNQFDGADFDQDDTNGNRNNNELPVKQEGVIAAPR